MIVNIKTDQDMELYLEHFRQLDEEDREVELKDWEERMKGEYSNFEFLTFLKVLDYLGIENDNDDLFLISELDKTRKELEVIVDCILDGCKTRKGEIHIHDSSKELMDQINQTLNECDSLYKYYNEKVIN